MVDILGDLLPLAVGVALSPVPIIAVILTLGTAKARSNGPAFAVGWVVGLAVVSSVVVVLAGGTDEPDSGPSTAVDLVKLLVGLLFVVMALKQWHDRPRAGEDAAMPSWMTTVDAITPGRSLALGGALSGLNPKNLALTAAAAATTAQAGLDGTQTTLSIVVFVVIGSLTVAGPVLYYVVASEKAAAPLASVKDFLSSHNAVIMMIVLLVLGAKVLGQGLAGLLS